MSDVARRIEDKDAVKPEADTRYRPKSKVKKFGLEFRIREELHEQYRGLFFGKWIEWQPYYFKYATEKDREQGLKTLNRNDRIHEYRIPNE
jgi:hypothetical protein